MQSHTTGNTTSGTPLRETLRLMASKILPHDSTKTTCPPAPLVSGAGPTIIVSSLMRSGTHLLLDSLFNNYLALRRFPLFVDFDAYERQGLPVTPLNTLCGVVIKTHYPETPLAGPYATALAKIAARSIVLTPNRNSEEVRNSLAKWGMDFSPAEFADIENRFKKFWSQYSPTVVEFRRLLDPAGVQSVLGQVSQRTGLESERSTKPVMPASSRYGVYFDKTLTRIAGGRAPRINTTIGYRLAPKQR
jgi:hypothetical protein